MPVPVDLSVETRRMTRAKEADRLFVHVRRFNSRNQRYRSVRENKHDIRICDAYLEPAVLIEATELRDVRIGVVI